MTTKRHLFSSVAEKLSKIFGKDKKAEIAEVAEVQPQATETTPPVIRKRKPRKPRQIAPPTTHERTLGRMSVEEGRDVIETYILQHLSEPDLGVEQMAEHLKTGRTTLFNLIHEYYDMTPGSYITQRRLDLAMELLSHGMRPSAVATRCGFSDPKYFSKVFKKYFGMLPSEWRRKQNSAEQNSANG